MRSAHTIAPILVATLFATLAAVGCQPADDDPSPETEHVAALRQALPRAETMTLQMPSANALVAEQSEMYRFTREITLHVNFFVRSITNLVEDVAELPPSETDDETYAVWGPYQDPLSPATWQLRANRRDDGSVEYAVVGWPRAGAPEQAQVVLEGSHVDGELPGQGTGSWTYYLTTGHTLDPLAHPSVGTIMVDYEIAAGRDLEVSFEGVQGPDDALPTSTLYRYTEAADRAGTFDFISNLDMDDDEDPAKPRRELVQVRSRWLATGEGRCDVLATHGDLPVGTHADVVECWDTAFVRSFQSFAYNGGALQEEGDLASCPYAEREVPTFEGFDADAFADDDLVEAIPTPADVDFEPAPVADPAEEQALYYLLTRSLVDGIHVHILGVLRQLEAVTVYPPSSCRPEGCTWGPWSDLEQGVSYQLVVERAAEAGRYDFAFELKAFGAPDDQWQPLTQGTFLESDDESEGEGSFVYDLDLLATVSPEQGLGGSYVAEFSKRDGVAEVGVQMRDVTGEDQVEPTNAAYRLVVAEDRSGTLDIEMAINVDDDPARAAVEQLLARTRWNPTGAGVATAKVTGGDLGDDQVALAVECWDERAAQSHLAYGVQAIEEEARLEPDAERCVFADWSEPQAPEVGQP